MYDTNNYAKVAELVDALDSGSSGQIACGGSSPPFRMSLLLAAATFLLIGLAGVGCKSDAEKTVETTLESTLELHDQVYRILETNVDDPDAALTQLRKLEESSREQRKRYRQDGQTAIQALSDEARATFEEHASERHAEYAGKFSTMLKRFEESHRGQLKSLVSTITH